MSGRAHDEDRWRDSPPGASGTPGDDVLEHGGRWPPPLAWRPRRATVILAVAALAAALAGGYAAGRYTSPRSAPARSSAASAGPAAPLGVADSPLAATGVQCSAQVGSDLQLGEQITNTSAVSVTVRRVTAVLPLGGLQATTQAWGPCGELPEPGFTPSGVIRGGKLAAGASVWFTVTFRVLVSCPQPLPVQFTMDYEQLGRLGTAHVLGFSDLSQVPYGHCP